MVLVSLNLLDGLTLTGGVVLGSSWVLATTCCPVSDGCDLLSVHDFVIERKHLVKAIFPLPLISHRSTALHEKLVGSKDAVMDIHSVTTGSTSSLECSVCSSPTVVRLKSVDRLGAHCTIMMLNVLIQVGLELGTAQHVFTLLYCRSASMLLWLYKGAFIIIRSTLIVLVLRWMLYDRW